MTTKFQCACGKKLSAPDSAIGKKARCPNCQNVMRVPDPDAPIEAEIVEEEEAPAAPEEPEPLANRLGNIRPESGAFKHLTSQLEKRTGTVNVQTSGKALVVDDEPDTLATISDLLEHHGFEVFRAADGEEAIKLAYEHKPDVVLLDVMLPGMNGFEVCRRLKDASTPGRGTYDARTPVLMLTARTKNRDVQYGMSVGADEYLKKPIKPLKLYRKIEKVMNR